MSKLSIATIVLVAAASANAQYLDGVTTVATRTITVAPTESVIGVTVNPPAQRTFDEVIVKVKEIGLGIEHLAQVSSTAGISYGVPGVPDVPARTTYTFSLPVPLAQTAATLQKVTTFAAANAGYTAQGLVTSVRATTTAAQDAHRTAFAELYREAKARAEEIARQAGLSPGKVLSVTDSFQTAAFSVYNSFQFPITVAVRIAID